ncbi:MAG: hypothetical protein LBM98_04630 [Oscillospiraceae bacterium]|nr:hypothetical protein [Oscillospiraceae bacterium]
MPTYRRILRQPWIASPHINGTYRKCGGGFAKTGWAKPSPVPAHCAGTVDGCCAGSVDGSSVRARRGEGGFETRPYGAAVVRVSRNQLSKAPLFRGGERPQTRGVSPAGRTNVQTTVIIHYSLSIVN